MQNVTFFFDVCILCGKDILIADRTLYPYTKQKERFLFILIGLQIDSENYLSIHMSNVNTKTENHTNGIKMTL